MKFDHSQSGDPFVPNANLKNAIVDMLNRDPSIGNANPGGMNIKANELLVVNDCDKEIGILTPAVITGLGTNNLDVTNVFEHQVYKVQKATDETKDNPVVIVREYLNKKNTNETAPIEKAMFSGIVPVKVKVSDVTHKFVEFDATGDFISASSGKYKLLYPPAATGDQLLKIILGAGGESGDTYNGYFKVIDTSTPAVPAEGENPAQPAVAKIKIVDGFSDNYSTSLVAGDALINDVFFADIEAKEFIITAPYSYIYLIATAGDNSPNRPTLEMFTEKQTYYTDKSCTLITRIRLISGKISKFSKEVDGVIIGYIDGDCEE